MKEGLCLLLLIFLGLGAFPGFTTAREEPPVQAHQFCDEEAINKIWPAELPGALETARKFYMKGKCALERGETRKALGFFKDGLKTEPALGDYWRRLLLKGWLASGNMVEAREIVAALSKEDKDPEIREAVRLTLLEFAKTGEPKPLYRLALAYFQNAPATPDDFEWALLYYKLIPKGGGAHKKQLAEKYKAEKRLWKTPKDKKTARDWKHFPLKKIGGKRLAISAEELVVRIKNLHAIRDYEQIISDLSGKWLPKMDAKTARKMGTYYFRSLIRKKEYWVALKRLSQKKIWKKFNLNSHDRLALRARIRLRRNHMKKAISLIDRLLKKKPNHRALPGFYLSVARHYGARKNTRLMIKWVNAILRRFPNHWVANEAYWQPIWQNYRRKKYRQALNWSEKAIANTQASRPEVRSRFYFWKGRILENLKNTEEAEKTFKELGELWPTTFYGLLSQLESHRFTMPPRKLSKSHYPLPIALDRPELNSLWKHPPLKKGVFLMAVGEVEQAEKIFGRQMGKPMAKDVLQELGNVFAYFRLYRLQQRLIANYFYNDLQRTSVADNQKWRMAYPMAFWEVVMEKTSAQNMSPYFALAIMREESHFHASANSITGARGLMQLMPATARQTAKRNRIKFQEALLVEPELNISLGVLYLKHVLKRFSWNPLQAAGAYNAGPSTMRRWKRKFGKRPMEDFVESIPYDETRAYIKRVISSYLIYSELYAPR